jgi:hypothetical protein
MIIYDHRALVLASWTAAAMRPLLDPFRPTLSISPLGGRNPYLSVCCIVAIIFAVSKAFQALPRLFSEKKDCLFSDGDLRHLASSGQRNEGKM